MSKKVVLSENSKMRLEMEVEGTNGVVRPVGIVDEDVNFGVILSVMSQLGMPLKALKFDLGQVSRMNSCGVREWLILIEKLPEGVECGFENVNELLVEQANMIPGILGRRGMKVISFQAPYFCETCSADVPMLIEPSQVAINDGIPQAPPFKCPKCSNPLQFDWLEEEYFAFLRRK
jgi:hypothetical protein